MNENAELEQLKQERAEIERQLDGLHKRNNTVGLRIRAIEHVQLLAEYHLEEHVRLMPIPEFVRLISERNWGGLAG